MTAANPPSTRLAMLSLLFVLAFMAIVCAGLGPDRLEYHVFALATGHNPFKLTASTIQAEEASRRRGDAIVVALRQHHADTGVYPARLDDLVPKYLAAIEPPVVGYCRWEYKLDAKKGFVLRYFVGAIYENDRFAGDSKEWYIDR